MTSFIGAINDAAGALSQLAGGKLPEKTRQKISRDDRFYQNIVCFFELQMPVQSFLFPLVYAPTQYQLSEPFAVEITPTDNAGFYVEEMGVVQRRLSIAGHTGFNPHPLPIQRPLPPSEATLPLNYSSRNLQSAILTALSGQRHFEFLQETVFRRYSDLKRDPSTAAATKLYWHNPRDAEHFQVCPMQFSVARSAANPFVYPYSIDLLVLGPATPTVFPMAEADKGCLDQFRDAISSINSAFDSLTGAVDDLTRLQGSFSALGNQVSSVIDRASTLAQACSSFLVGTQRLINSPLASVFALFNLAKSVTETFAALVDIGVSVADWPPVVLARFRAMQNACDELLVQTGAFKAPINARIEAVNNSGNVQISVDNTVQATSFAQIRAAGSANLPGDAAIFGASQPTPRRTPLYQSIRTIIVRRGDTLLLIGQRELGAAAAWRDIATLNDIATRGTSASQVAADPLLPLDTGAPVLTVGQKLLIPSVQPPAQVAANPAVLGARPTDSQEVQLYGRDLALVLAPQAGAVPQYDLDLAGSDLATVEGTHNLVQAVTLNVVQARGDSPLYPTVGLDSFIGTGLVEADDAMRTYRITQALTADARIASIKSVVVQEQGDKVLIDAELVPVSGAQNATVSLAL